jgi:hypothetical protein
MKAKHVQNWLLQVEGLHANLVFSLKRIKISHNSILFARLCLKVVDISKAHLGLYGDFDLGRV